jgi:hypothetical protein
MPLITTVNVTYSPSTLPFRGGFNAPVPKMTAWTTVTPTIDHQSDAEAAWRILFKEGI